MTLLHRERRTLASGISFTEGPLKKTFAPSLKAWSSVSGQGRAQQFSKTDILDDSYSIFTFVDPNIQRGIEKDEDDDGG